MTFESEEKGDVVVFALEGKFMGGSEGVELRNALQTYIDKEFKKVVIDFANLTWANSSGIGVIVSMFLTMKRIEGDLRTVRLTEKVDFYFRISKLNQDSPYSRRGGGKFPKSLTNKVV